MKRLLLLIVFVASWFSIRGEAQRLPKVAVPENYDLTLVPDLQNATFQGDETIRVLVLSPTSAIVLNAAELRFTDTTITSGGKSQVAKVVLDPATEMATLTVPEQLEAGAASIRIRFTGKLNNELRGFYLGHENKRTYAATQFEATDARRAFPSFDEPQYKATFDISAIADKGDIAVSNGKVISDTPGPGPEKHTVKFATSSKMSSYLVTLIVGDFKYIQGEQDGIPIRVWATPGKENMGQFALEAAKQILAYYDRYFGIKYPYPKLDMVALPDFSAGAMENTACITYREILLLLEDQHASLQAKRGVASVEAHEMAHQWFGDLVTMQWWDDIWLNEGFATWMSSKPLEAWRPQWHLELEDVRATGDALNLDSLRATRPIRQKAETPAQIQELFDGIAYGKTAAVLRMLESYLGEEGFRAGVNAYLKAHAYRNATASDFWTAMAQSTHKPVDQIMPTFVDQPGAPVIDVAQECAGPTARVRLSQHRYYYDREPLAGADQQVWQVPVCLRTAGERTPHCELLKTQQATFTLPGRCSSWVIANAGAEGYYRTFYQPHALQKVAESLQQGLTPAERIVLLRDDWAGVRSASLQIGDFMALASEYRGDRTPDVIEDLLRRLRYIGDHLVTDSDRGAYESYVRNLLQPIARELGWEAKPGEPEERDGLRARLLATLGYTGKDAAALGEGKKLAEKALAAPGSVDPTLVPAVFQVAVVDGNSALYDEIRGHLKTATSPEQYYTYLNALTGFSDPALLQRTLELALTPEIRTQDAFIVIAQVLANPAGSKLAWDFSRAHWADIQKIGGSFAGAFLVQTTASFCDPQARDQVRQFFSEHPVAEAERSLRQTLESINACIDLRAEQSQNLAAWLQQHSNAAAAGE